MSRVWPNGFVEELFGQRRFNKKPCSRGLISSKFFSTHPNQENRIARIEEAIQEQFPGGVPEG